MNQPQQPQPPMGPPPHETTTDQITLSDGSGGLNNRELPANLKPNQFSQLENIYTDEGGFPGKQVPGATLVQYAPINPQPYVPDAQTISHFKFDETVSPVAIILDEVSGYNMTSGFISNSLAPSVAALFPIGAGLGRSASGQSSNPPSAGACFVSGQGPILDGLLALTIRGWVNIPESFTSAPFPLPTFPGQNGSNNGAVLFGTTDEITSRGGGHFPSEVQNGFQLFRLYDSELNSDAGPPTVSFTLHTKGIAGEVTFLNSGPLPTGKWLELCATYDSTTGLAKLYVTGNLVDQKTVNGAGPVDDSATTYLACLGGEFIAFDGPWGGIPKTCAGVIMDEWEIASTVRTEFLYELPRGNPKEFGRSDGTVQLLGTAGDGVFFTIGDGNWAPVKTGLSQDAIWDFIQLGDIVYMANGVDPPMAWDGAMVVPWGEGVSPVTITELGSGTLLAGTYKYAYTYVYGEEETGPSPLAQHTSSAPTSLIISDIPTRHANASAVNIYRTKAGGTTLYLLRQILNNPNQASLSMSGPYVAGTGPFDDSGSDDVADSVLGTGGYAAMTAEVFTTKMRNPQYLTSNFDRIFMAGIDNLPYSMYWTEPGLPDIVFALSFVQDHGGRKITAVSQYTGEVHAHKDGRGCLVLRGNSPSNWTEFESLHPTRGATDHFGIVYRTSSRNFNFIQAQNTGEQTDKSELCFPSVDGFYGYVGYEFYRIDDPINATFQSLAVANSTKQSYITTSQSQFQVAKRLGGSTTENIQADSYSVDGLREVPGEIRIVDQLQYLGLWQQAAALVLGNVIAMVSGPAEGEFFFSTDADSKLYRTTDNFQTAAVAANLTALAGLPGTASAHCIIEIVHASIGGKDKYWVFTDRDITATGSIAALPLGTGPGAIQIQTGSTAGLIIGTQLNFYNAAGLLVEGNVSVTSVINGLNFTVTNTAAYAAGFTWKAVLLTASGGMIGLWNQTDGFFENSSTVMAGPYFWTADVPRHFGQPQLFNQEAANIVTADQGYSFPGDNIGAAQKLIYSVGRSLDGGEATNNLRITHPQTITPFVPADTTSGRIGGQRFTVLHGGGFSGICNTRDFVDIGPASGPFHLPADYYCIRDSTSTFHDLQNTIQFRWQFFGQWSFNFSQRENPYWLGGTFRPQAFWDATTGKLFFSCATTEGADGNRPSLIVSLKADNTFSIVRIGVGFMALVKAGVNAYFTESVLDLSSSQFGTNVFLKIFDLATGTVSTVGREGKNFLTTRLAWNANSSQLIATGKQYISPDFGTPQPVDNFNYDSNGFIASVNTSNGAYTSIKQFTISTYLNPGAFPAETVYQNDAPFSVLAIMQNIQPAEPSSVYAVDASGNLEVFNSSTFDSAVTGLTSNAIFVPSSGAAGGFLWSDRIYFCVKHPINQNGAATFSFPVQLGLPGNWTVAGTFVNELKNLGVFDAFGAFNTTYQGQVAFLLANGNVVPFGPSDFKPLTPNQKITISGTKPGRYVQWQAILTWNYSVAATPTESPFLDFVSIDYFLGQSLIPRLVSIHYEGRTRWSVAQLGQPTNNLEIVYQKNNSWTTCTGRKISGYAIFRGALVAFDGYSLIQLETGNTYLGNLIAPLAVTGYIMNEAKDRHIRQIIASLMEYSNPTFPKKTGWWKVRPIASGVERPDGDFNLAIPATAGTPFPVQVQAAMAVYKQVWVRALALKIMASDDASGATMAVPGQALDVQAIILKIRSSPTRSLISVP